MHKQLGLALTVLISNVNFFENIMKPDIKLIQNSVGPDQLASFRSQLNWTCTVFQTTCKFKIFHPI